MEDERSRPPDPADDRAPEGDGPDVGPADDASSGANPELDRHAPLSPRDQARHDRREGILRCAQRFAAALAEGRITVEHVDVLASVLGDVRPEVRDRVLRAEASLVALARTVQPKAFADAVRRAVDRAAAEEGMELAERLLANTRLRQWDGDDGLHHVHLTLDPEHAGRFNAALQAEIEALFHSGEFRELDHEQRAARALVNLVVAGEAAPRRSDPGRAEFLLLADLETMMSGLHDRSILETAGGRTIHLETARRLWCDADTVTWAITVEGHVLSLVTEDELANRKQRRAMRSMYRTCVHPDCDVPFDRCHLHHVRFRQRGGKTVIENLLPLCYPHHHLVHEGGWILGMDSARTVRWQRPDGTVYATVPYIPLGADEIPTAAMGPPGSASRPAGVRGSPRAGPDADHSAPPPDQRTPTLFEHHDAA